jgi:hypothetical protein
MMSQRRLGIAGGALIALLCLPRESAAGLGDIIWGMSGPQMVGVVAHCRVEIGRPITDCHILNRPADGKVEPSRWWSLEGGLYGSTPRNSDDGNDEYGWFDVGMLTFEPVYEVRWAPGLSSGAGVGYNFLFGKDFGSFHKFNLKIRVLAVESPQATLAVNLRYYPEGFTSDEFGFGERQDIDRPAEFNIGFSVGFRKLWLW